MSNILFKRECQDLSGIYRAVFEEFTAVKIDIATLKEGQKNLDKRLDSVETRLNTVTLGVFGIIGVLVTGLLTFVGKFVFFPNL
jgi:hypothetical protein